MSLALPLAHNPPLYDAWVREITDNLVTILNIRNGDAQGVVEVHPFELSQEWVKGSTGAEAAKRLSEI